MESHTLIPLREKRLLLKRLEVRRGRMQKPNGNVTIKPKPIQGTGTTNG